MQLFYQPNIEIDWTLDADDSRHCIKVLRHTVGDKIHVIDGRGGLFEVQITEANSKRCKVDLVHASYEWQKPTKYVHIAIAPTKNIDRINYFVEKAVEVGISEVSFILCEHSERKVIKTDRVQRIAIAAMKQSLKAYLPKINELSTLEEFSEKELFGQKLVAHLSEDSVDLSSLKNFEKTTLLVGPEGDFSTDELKMLNASGFSQVTMGKSRLRTETAGLVGVTLLNMLN